MPLGRGGGGASALAVKSRTAATRAVRVIARRVYATRRTEPQIPVQVEAQASAQLEGRFSSAALAKLPRRNKRSAVAIREPIVGLGVAGVERQTDAWIVVTRVVQAVDRGEADVVLYPDERLR